MFPVVIIVVKQLFVSSACFIKSLSSVAEELLVK